MKLLNFKLVAGPFGDETSRYDVVINKEGATIANLIDYVVNEKSDWGYINVWKKDATSIKERYRFEYSWGKTVSDNIPEDVKQLPLKRIVASGGWSRMDYDVYLED